ncbi:hypothetical protein C1I98_29295 [Spongiactinospora gelatinilytica]|uniref:Signal transduction histidine kinase subgroup 3 dimerisation and phosphoacceptor domain-containing protein n=1 Tax=Spongiactinospora gelatinilytica TaxID=2666298 RepID=A0A2W2FAA5_9ACTN|nr:histidine kinase [Spongiactinospora gelatinilytica]PZG32531.1 hypothetical protein C1I98_29295 [Spongiactinospora gelatinilytica]
MRPGELVTREARWALRAGSLLWLLLPAWPLWAFLAERPHLVPALWALGWWAAFAACWGRFVWNMFSDRALIMVPWVVTGMAAATLALFPVLGHNWAYASFPLLVSLLVTLPPGWFLAGVAGVVVLELTALTAFGLVFAEFWWVPVLIAAEATAVRALTRMGHALYELETARAEVARLAVDNERLRFARDLHDILGHTLTSITIRSQPPSGASSPSGWPSAILPGPPPR